MQYPYATCLLALSAVCATESKDYCEFCASKVELWVLPVAFILYAVVVAVIFLVAEATSVANTDNPHWRGLPGPHTSPKH